MQGLLLLDGVRQVLDSGGCGRALGSLTTQCTQIRAIDGAGSGDIMRGDRGANDGTVSDGNLARSMGDGNPRRWDTTLANSADFCFRAGNNCFWSATVA